MNVVSITERADLVDAFLAAIDGHDIDAAVAFFAPSARVVSVGYDPGQRVERAETVATGTAQIELFISGLVEDRVRIRPSFRDMDGDTFVVRADWSLMAFHGEVVHSHSIGRYSFTGTLISLLLIVTPEDVGR